MIGDFCCVVGCDRHIERGAGVTVCAGHEGEWDRRFTLREWTLMNSAQRSDEWRRFIAGQPPDTHREETADAR